MVYFNKGAQATNALVKSAETLASTHHLSLLMEEWAAPAYQVSCY